jgi:hypothetical protein
MIALCLSDKKDTAVRIYGLRLSKMRDSNKTLISIGSGVLLHENQAAPDISVPTLDGQRKTLKRVRAENRNHANMCIENMYIWADCGRAARQVIGRNQGTRGVYKDPANGGRNPIWKGTVRTPDPEVMKWKILEDVLRIYENQLGRKLLNEAEITKLKNENNRRKLAKYFLGVYSQLPPKTRNDLDRRIGINRWANPQVGQAYTISSGGPSVWLAANTSTHPMPTHPFFLIILLTVSVLILTDHSFLIFLYYLL